MTTNPVGFCHPTSLAGPAPDNQAGPSIRAPGSHLGTR